MKASEAQTRAALDRPSPDIRLYLLFGPDEAGAMALADRLARAKGPDAERIDLDGATLKSDPARLADEAASLSLFGGARHIRATGVGDESAAAVAALLNADRAGDPVVLVAPNLKTTSALVKLAVASPRALACGCYAPTGREAEALAGNLAREHGLRLAGDAARRLADASGGDRSVMAREVEKLALYLDAAADRPQTLDDAAFDAVGADLGEAEMGRVIAAVIAGRADKLADELARLSESGVSPVAWLRQLARRLASLAEMRVEVEAGENVAGVMKRHRVFRDQEASTREALARWSPVMLAAAHARSRAAERAVMAPSNAGVVLADHVALDLARRLEGR